MTRYLVLYEQGPASWGAYVPDLPGCFAVGQTREQVEERIRGAIALHLRALRDDGDPIPAATHAAGTVCVAA